MKMLRFASIVFLALASCASAPKWEWQHPHRTVAERDADYDYCRKEVNKSTWGGGFFTSPASFHSYQEEKDAYKVRCMQDMGYTAVRVEGDESY